MFFLLLSTLARDIHFFFFFQAEDGIRDLTVTGVQTCALPISRASPLRCSPGRCASPWSPRRWSAGTARHPPARGTLPAVALPSPPTPSPRRDRKSVV